MAAKKEPHLAILLNRRVLIFLGIWMVGPEDSFFMKVLNKLTIMVGYFCAFFLLVPCALHTFLDESNTAVKLKLIGAMSFVTMAVCKYTSLVCNIKNLDGCLKHVEQDWRLCQEVDDKEQLDVMREKAKLGRFFMSLSAIFMYGGGFFYHTIMPLSSGRIAVTDLNEDFDFGENDTDVAAVAHGSRGLTYPIYRHLMNVDKSPVYEIVFLAQFLAGAFLYTITVSVCGLAAAFVVHVCGELENVMTLLNAIANDERIDAAKNDKQMAEIVERHLRAISFANRVESILNFIFCVEIIGCTLNICFLGYYFLAEWQEKNTISSMTYSILFMSFMFNIFMFCHIGETLTEQCEEVGEVTYGINWYNLQHKKAADLIMLIVMSSCRPARLTAGKMVNLSMSTFSNVIKTAGTYLNLLRTAML